jgi:predicted RNA-binding protein with PIN domain
MQSYIIDGNNLIGKIKELQQLQKKDKQASREKLAFMIDNFFMGKKILVSLHFDGYQNTPIKITSGKIIYSQNQSADDKIKAEIIASGNPKTITLVSSDNNLRQFAQVCRASVILAEEFAAEIYKRDAADDEEKRIQSINNVEEFKRIFNIKK